MSIAVIRVKDLDSYIRKENVQIIDVRKREEFERGHIENADCIPFEELLEHVNQLDKSKVILLYCERGNVSLRAGRELNQMGYKVINVSGGIQNYGRLHKE